MIIGGSRGFSDYLLLEKTILEFILTENISRLEIVTGMCRGADRLGERFAKQYGVDLLYYPADWNKHGKSAGFIRNEEMAKNSTHCIVFWDGSSRGSMHMINLAKKYNLILKVVRYIAH